MIRRWAVSFLLVTIGCRSSTPETPPIPPVKFPDWVVRGPGASSRPGTRLILGVGVSREKNLARARSAAAESARSLALGEAKEVLKDLAKKSEKQDRGEIEVLRSQCDEALEVVEYWSHPHDEATYALAQIDLSVVIDLGRKKGKVDKAAAERIGQAIDERLQGVPGGGLKPEPPSSH
jgi:hypothetical protein